MAESRKDRLFGLEEIPTFHPTAEEFQDPLQYIDSLKQEGRKYGMVKISPPAEYRPDFALNTEEFRFKTHTQKINQLDTSERINFLKKLARYHRIRSKKVKLPQQVDRKPIDLYQLKLTVTRLGGHLFCNEHNKWPEISIKLGHAPRHASAMASTIKITYINVVLPYEVWEAQHKDVDMFQIEEIVEKEVDGSKACEACLKTQDEANMMLCDGCSNGYHLYCLSPPLRYVPRTDWFCSNCLDSLKDASESTSYTLTEFEDKADRFKKKWFHTSKIAEGQCEREFWVLVKSSQNVEVEHGLRLHGTEHGSGFPVTENLKFESFDPWNLNIIPVSPHSLFTFVKSENHQLMTPWLYVGMCFSALSWQMEEHSTYSVSYLHWGEPKTHYSIPRSSLENFELVVKKFVPDLFYFQPDLMCQSIAMFSPEDLVKENVEVFATEQLPGQFIVTFPKVYHSELNHGFNFSESVNFAPEDWVEDGLASVKLYKEHKKPPCFSHDEMLVTAAEAIKNGYKPKTDWLESAMAEMCQRELSERTRSRSRKIKNEIVLEDDQGREVQCNFCHCFNYLSYITCACKRVTCGEHIKDSCNCPQASKTLYIRHPDEQLKEIARSVKDNSCTSDQWVSRLICLMQTNPSVEALIALHQEGLDVGVSEVLRENLKCFITIVEEWIESAKNVLDPTIKVEGASHRVEKIEMLQTKAKTINYSFVQTPMLEEYKEALEAYDRSITRSLLNTDNAEEKHRVIQRGVELGADSQLFNKLKESLNCNSWQQEVQTAISKTYDPKVFKALILKGKTMKLESDPWYASLLKVDQKAQGAILYLQRLIKGNEKITSEMEYTLDTLGLSLEDPKHSFRLDRSLIFRAKQAIEESRKLMNEVDKLMNQSKRPTAAEGFTLLGNCSKASLTSERTNQMKQALDEVRHWNNELIGLLVYDQRTKQRMTLHEMLLHVEHVLTVYNDHDRICFCRSEDREETIKCAECHELFHEACVGITNPRAHSQPFVCKICKSQNDNPTFEDFENLLLSSHSLMFYPYNYEMLETIYNNLVQFRKIIRSFLNSSFNVNDVRRILLCIEGLCVQLPIETGILKAKINCLSKSSNQRLRPPTRVSLIVKPPLYISKKRSFPVEFESE
ncbi:JmjC domain, hydroxylase-domain-containing protein [Sporodiniella umbellata]|nr:JmjC domain, hydroxylase-domain-containing protein [Sporodiniella umbellata]